MSAHVVPLLAVVQETPRDRTLVLPVPHGHAEAYRFKPGQFLTIRDLGWDRGLKRAYSLSGSPNETGILRITVRDDGRMGGHLYALMPGASVEIAPPQGKFVLDLPVAETLVLVTGGAGVGPFRAFLRALKEGAHRGPVTLFSSARTPSELLFHAEMTALAREVGWFRYVPTVTRAAEDRTWTGHRGRIDRALLTSALKEPARTLVYTCGPTLVVEAVSEWAAELGVPAARIRKEKWG